MRALTFAATVVVATGSGCGLAIPFQVARGARVTLPMGPVDPQCSKVSADRTRGDVHVAFAHHAEGNTCVVTSAWSGPLFDVIARFNGSGAPVVTAHTSDRLAALVNKAWHEESKVDGDGACDVHQALDEIDALSAAAAPAMVLDCTLTMKGTTHASLGG